MSKLKQLFPKWLIVILVMTLSGIIFITIYFVSPKEKTIFIEIVGTIGKTILGSGVFFAILKSIQFLGIFKEELHRIMYSDVLLAKRNDIKDIWKIVTRSVYQTAFPSISNKIEDIIQRQIPDKLNYYHKDLHVVYEINYIDDNHFELIESQNFKIISDGKEFVFELNNYFCKLNDDADKSSFFMNLTINENDYSHEIIATESIVLEDNQLEKKYNLKTSLLGSMEYNVQKVTRTIHTNLLNGYWKFEIGRVTDSFTIDIRNTGKYELDLLPIGNNTALHKMFISSTLNISKHSDIMMPGDGFLILIKPRLR
jgi:hypothetical protein